MQTSMRSVAIPAGRAPGGVLLHPLALAALGVLILTDHVLKQAMPGPVTGKLSDIAGMLFLPLLLVAAWQLLGRGRTRATIGPVLAVLVTGAGFAIVKTQPAAADAFGAALGVAQWLMALPVELVANQALPVFAPARVLADPTDLIALPALAVAAWLLRPRRVRR